MEFLREQWDELRLVLNWMYCVLYQHDPVTVVSNSGRLKKICRRCAADLEARDGEDS